MKYQDLIDACRQDWQEYTEHALVRTVLGKENPALPKAGFSFPKTVRTSLRISDLQSTYFG